MTGRRNRAHAPPRFLPPRPSPPFGFLYGSKNGTARIFSFSEQPQNSVRTSLVPLSICLWEVLACGASKTLRRSADPYSPWLGSASKSNTLKVRANQAKLPTNIISPIQTPKRRPDTIKSDRRSAIKILKYLKLSRPGIKKDPGRFNSPDAKFSKFVRSSKCFRIFQTPDHSAFHEMIE